METPPARIAYSPREAAAALGVGESTVLRLCEAKKLPHVRVGRRIVISKKVLEAFVEATPEE